MTIELAGVAGAGVGAVHVDRKGCSKKCILALSGALWTHIE